MFNGLADSFSMTGGSISIFSFSFSNFDMVTGVAPVMC